MELMMEKTIFNNIPIKLIESEKGKKWKIMVIQTGESLNHNIYPKEVLLNAVPLFNNVKVYAYEYQGKFYNHLSDSEELPQGYALNLVGVLKNPQYEEIETKEGTIEGITAELHIFNDKMKKLFLNMWEEGFTDVLGFSVVQEALVDSDKYPGKNYVVEIKKVESVDVVSSPAAGGRILKLLESIGGTKMDKNSLIEAIKKINPSLLEGKNVDELTEVDLEELLYEAIEKLEETKNNSKDKEKEEKKEEKEGIKKESGELLLILNKVIELVKDKKNDEAIEMLKELIKSKSGYGYPAPYGEAKEEPKESLELKSLIEEVEKLKSQLTLEKLLNESKLPDFVKDKIKKMFEGKIVSEDEIKKAIEIEKEALQKISESVGVSFFGGQQKVDVIREEVDRKRRALELFVGYQPDESERKLYEGIKPYRTLREAYEDITKDYGVTFNPTHFAKIRESYPEGFISANFPYLLQDALNKRLAKEYPMVALETWRKFCSVVPVSDFNPQRVIRWGSLDTLATINEGADYPDYTIGSSSLEEVPVYTPFTKGVVISITRQMILSDKLQFIQKIPKIISRAASRTLNQFVFDLLINYGGSPTPSVNGGTIYDGLALYHNNHRNLLTSPLTFESLLEAREKMMKQYVSSMVSGSTEIDYIGITPKFLIVPPELQTMAEIILNSDKIPGSADNDVNILKGKFELIVSHFLRDGENWYLVADPNECDTIEIGFVQGKDKPEIFVQDNPLTGFSFTADKITYKVRYEFGGAVIDYRAFVGSIVV